MSDSEGITYGLAARLRLAVADQAAQISDSAAEMVPTCGDGNTSPVELDASPADLVEMSYHLAVDGCELLTLSVAHARQLGVSWDAIGGMIGAASQAVQDRYAAAVKRLTDAIVLCWLLGDDPRFAILPEAATNPVEGATRLDRWVRDRLALELRCRNCDRRDGCCHERDHPSGEAPVSFNLPTLGIDEYYAFIATASEIVMERLAERGVKDSEVARLQLKLAGQKVALFERLLIEEALEHDDDGGGTGRLASLLDQARAEVAELEQRGDGVGLWPPGHLE
jgi:hypothetical protein